MVNRLHLFTSFKCGSAFYSWISHSENDTTPWISNLEPEVVGLLKDWTDSGEMLNQKEHLFTADSDSVLAHQSKVLTWHDCGHKRLLILPEIILLQICCFCQRQRQINLKFASMIGCISSRANNKLSFVSWIPHLLSLQNCKQAWEIREIRNIHTHLEQWLV